VTRRRFGMHSDTAVAPDADGDCERDQLPDLRPEQMVFWPAALSVW